MKACPSREQLAFLLAERLEEAERPALEAHVEGCRPCQDVLAELSRDAADPPFEARTAPTADAASLGFLRRVKEMIGHVAKTPDTSATLGPAAPAPAGDEPLPDVPGYEILAELGRGGMGVVYKARHLGLNRLVALKMLLASRFATADGRRRFQREAQAIARLRHANIVQVYDVGETSAGPFFSLELVEAGSLARRLHGTPWPPRHAAALVEQLALAIQYAHDHGVIHRDLKPANVLLGVRQAFQPDSSAAKDVGLESLTYLPKIADFGLAKCAEDDNAPTPNGAVLGTPGYLAPEQVTPSPHGVGPAADVYGLGAVLYELLTGACPFRGESAIATLLLVTHQEPVPPSRLGVCVPRDLETICLKCLQKAPPKRYASAAHLAGDLRRFLAGEPILARPPGPAERALKWAKRNKALAALAAVIVLAVLLGGGGGVWYAAERHARRATAEQRVNQLLDETTTLYQQAQSEDRNLALWAGALAAAQRADEVAAGGDVSPEVRGRVAALLTEITWREKNQRLVAALLAIQAGMGDDLLPNCNQDFPDANERYSQAFRTYGQNLYELTPEDGAEMLRGLGEGVRIEVAATLDNWAYVRTVLRKKKYPPNHLTHVSRLLDPDPLRDQIRGAVMKGDGKALVRLAARIDPAAQSVQTVNLVGVYLYWFSTAGDYREAIAFLQAAQVPHAGDFQINHNLAFLLTQVGRADEAVPYAVAATAIRPRSAVAWQDRAEASRATGDDEAAVAAYRRVVALAPRPVWHLYWIGELCERQGKPDEAVAAYREALRRIPRHKPQDLTFYPAWQKYGLIDEAIAEYRRVIDADGKNLGARWGLTTVLYKDNRWAQYVAETERLIRLDDKRAEHHFYLGNALRMQGEDAAAVAAYRRCLALDPRYSRARRAIDDVERLLALEKRLPGLLDAEPARVADQLDLADSFLRRKRRYVEAVALFASAFAAEPGRAESAKEAHRYNAACAAALAGSGAGVGAEKVDAVARTRYRQQALAWLAADLAALARLLRRVPASAVDLPEEVRSWRRDPDLAGVRDDQALAKLPPDERAAWAAFWAAADRLAGEARASYAQSEHRGRLSASERERSHPLKVAAGKTYRLDADTAHFDPSLRLEDSQAKVVAEDAGSGRRKRGARVVFTAPADGAYRVVVTPHLKRGAGAYVLTVREFAAMKR